MYRMCDVVDGHGVRGPHGLGTTRRSNDLLSWLPDLTSRSPRGSTSAHGHPRLVDGHPFAGDEFCAHYSEHLLQQWTPSTSARTGCSTAS
ncbi:hypothetical protein HBB16_13010 [Pseudonocardia sp. MCCB 268]|nr:hypothetical protein [Pseudonocardia cytotoxica]